MAAAPQTSIVIRTLNEEAKLGDVLRALQGQTYQDFEVLLVDSGSKDGTVAIAEQFGATILRLDPGSFTFGRALNYGYERARGTYLVSLSGHAIPWCEGWLERLLSHLRAPDVAASTGGGFLPGDSPASRRTRVVRIEAANYKEAPLWGLNNAAGAVKAELWREHRFDEKLTGCEDCEWGWFWMKRGYALIWDEQCSVIHEHHETLPQQYRRSRREYAGLAAFLEMPRYGPREVLGEWLVTPLKEAAAALLRGYSCSRAAVMGGKYHGRRHPPPPTTGWNGLKTSLRAGSRTATDDAGLTDPSSP